MAVADVNGDGKPDLVVANDQSGTVSVLLGNGNGTFQAQATFATGSMPDSVAVADVNGDGKPDLIVANDTNPAASACCWATATAPSKARPALPPLPSLGPWRPGCERRRQARPGRRVRQRGDASACCWATATAPSKAQQTFATGADPASVAVGDLNGDGRPDLIVANDGSNTVSVLLNAGNGNFTGQVYTIDTIAPFVESINRTDADRPDRPTPAASASPSPSASRSPASIPPTFQLA